MAELQARVARFGEISLRHVPAAGTLGPENLLKDSWDAWCLQPEPLQ